NGSKCGDNNECDDDGFPDHGVLPLFFMTVLSSGTVKHWLNNTRLSRSDFPRWWYVSVANPLATITHRDIATTTGPCIRVGFFVVSGWH
ncbi:hypothetical protein, partial [Serratia proteamaculans]|uniref:hypothetical protein n=1 Tax=Serratia proteamaculans TaxID=28151 RepID=UPI001E47728D